MLAKTSFCQGLHSSASTALPTRNHFSSKNNCTTFGSVKLAKCQHARLPLCSTTLLPARASSATVADSSSQHQTSTAQALPQPTLQRQARVFVPRLSAAEGRQALLRRIPLESFTIAGVSFEGRQDEVAKLQHGQAVMLVKEPNNEYDPDAIAVQTLSGQSLGYVPRDFNSRFPHDTTFARVHSVAPAADTDLLGVIVAVQPSLPPLTVEAFPANLAPHINMSVNLSEQDYGAIRKATYRNASYRCEVTGGVGSQWPVECHERWRFHDSSHTLQLMGFTALHPEVHAAKHLERQRTAYQRQQALNMLQAMNQWTAAEAEEYWECARATALDRSNERWTMDLDWLTDHAFTIPEHLQPLCQQSQAEDALHQ